jgi:uncharacterized repeat protein (TIGR03803 family)
MATLSLAILAASASAQIYKPVFRFDTSSVGLYPAGGLILDAAGNLYGTTGSGGSCSISSNGCGLAFELSPGASGWTETVLHSFTGPDGYLPTAGVVFDSQGNLYGTTYSGGAFNNGTVFELTPTASGWQQQVLYSFTGGSDGGVLPYGVVLDGAGNVYGTTYLGGTNNQGVLFQLTTSGSGWTENVLVNFDNLAGTGPSPLAFDQQEISMERRRREITTSIISVARFTNCCPTVWEAGRRAPSLPSPAAQPALPPPRALSSTVPAISMELRRA